MLLPPFRRYHLGAVRHFQTAKRSCSSQKKTVLSGITVVVVALLKRGAVFTPISTLPIVHFDIFFEAANVYSECPCDNSSGLARQLRLEMNAPAFETITPTDTTLVGQRGVPGQRANWEQKQLLAVRKTQMLLKKSLYYGESMNQPTRVLDSTHKDAQMFIAQKFTQISALKHYAASSLLSRIIAALTKWWLAANN